LIKKIFELEIHKIKFELIIFIELKDFIELTIYENNIEKKIKHEIMKLKFEILF